MKRCPFCEFARNPIDGDADYSHVGALREIAVHIVFQHPGEFQELAESVSGEWDGHFAVKFPIPSERPQTKENDHG